MKLKYDYNFLSDFIKINNINLIKDYSNININRDTKIEGKCVNDCKNFFNYSLRALIQSPHKGYCLECIKVKRREVLHENNLKKYGVINVFQSKDVKEKSIQTIIQKYGVNNVSQNKEIKIKKEETLFKNYGVTNMMKSEEIKNKIKLTNLEKYGVENVSQDPNISKKQNNYNYKNYIFKSGKTLKIQGYENFGIDHLLKEGIKEKDIETDKTLVPNLWYIDKNNKKRRHFVDIYLKNINKCIEIKSSWTLKKHYENVFLKQKYAKEKGYLYEILVFSPKGELINKFE